MLAARARLLYGEMLRRRHRRVDASEQLRAAHEVLSGCGMNGFAERAARELSATGETLRVRTPDAVEQLTDQELNVARLARDGLMKPRHRRAPVHQRAHRRELKTALADLD